MTIDAGTKLTLRVKGLSNPNWYTTNSHVAMVSPKGVVRGVSRGKVKICVDSPGRDKPLTCVVTVEGPTLKVDGDTTGMTLAEGGVYKRLVAMRKKYPEGTPFTNADYRTWFGGTFRGGYGCAGFAYELSDYAFKATEKNPKKARIHHKLGNAKVGDLLRLDDNGHSVIVLKTTPYYYVIAEANYNGKVHWGRLISKEAFENTGNYVMTRW